MSRGYPFHIACNDEHGNFARRAEGIILSGRKGEILVDLGLVGMPPKFDYGASEMRLSRHKYPISGFNTWVGNWCWNVYYLEPLHAGRLLYNLMRDKRWDCEGGWVEACDAWETRVPNNLMRLWARELWPPEPVLLVGSAAPTPKANP